MSDKTNETMIIIMTTFPIKNTKVLKKLIVWSIKQWLSTCVQQLNYMKSFYMLEWKLQRQHEKLLLFKWLEKNKEKLMKFMKSMHPYEIPEIVVLKADEVDEKYMGWMLWK